MNDELGWLIERRDLPQPVWWCGAGSRGMEWSPDSLEAIRFARKIDADMVNVSILGSCGDATEHKWIDTTGPAAVPPSPDLCACGHGRAMHFDEDGDHNGPCLWQVHKDAPFCKCDMWHRKPSEDEFLGVPVSEWRQIAAEINCRRGPDGSLLKRFRELLEVSDMRAALLKKRSEPSPSTEAVEPHVRPPSLTEMFSAWFNALPEERKRTYTDNTVSYQCMEAVQALWMEAWTRRPAPSQEKGDLEHIACPLCKGSGVCAPDASECNTCGGSGLRDGLTFHDIAPCAPAPDEPIPMVLHCPRCRTQHIDAPQPEKKWTNPPHRSHECQSCGFVWRPADVPTIGVEHIETDGKRDSDLSEITVLSATFHIPGKTTGALESFIEASNLASQGERERLQEAYSTGYRQACRNAAETFERRASIEEMPMDARAAWKAAAAKCRGWAVGKPSDSPEAEALKANTEPASPSTRDGVIEEAASMCDAEVAECMNRVRNARGIESASWGARADVIRGIATRLRKLKSHPAARAGEEKA